MYFALSGSSARKLKRGGANLLAGRAFIYKLFPFVFSELKQDFVLQDALRWGTLPGITKFNSDSDKSSFLKSYIETYLKEEIIAEQLVRNLSPFSRFLNIAGQSNASIVNFTKIAVDINTSPTNVINYYSILEDTLITYKLETFHQSIRKRQRVAPKIYFFDCGVVRALNGRVDVPLKAQTYEYGKLFETFIINQIRAYLTYQGKQFRLSYLQTKDNAEIDLIIERPNEKAFLLEIKSGGEVRDSELNNLRRFSKDIKNSHPICLYDGVKKLRIDDIDVLPWQDAFVEIGIH
jgi:predicted AAA+ superfamily ATPase